MLDAMIPLARPKLGETELRAVAEVLRSGQLVSGAQVERFERAMAERCGRAHAVAVSSGTSALELALAALDIGPAGPGAHDDQVIVPALTWPSPAHAVLLRGATPVLVDVHPTQWNTPADLYRAAVNDRTRAALVIDQLGNPAPHRDIVAALDGVPIIEDAACALGSRFDDGTPCGSLGAIACLSFHPRKIVATGEGGMCLTDDAALAERLRILRNHGQRAPGDFVEPAGNHRLTEVAAALGLAQLARLDAILDERRRVAERYRAHLPSLTFQEAVAGAAPNHQTIGAILPDGIDRDTLVASLATEGVQAGRLSYALSRVPTVASRALVSSNPVHTERIIDTSLALPAYEGMTDAEQDRVVDALRRALGA
jgi:perosamine synthetase